MNEVTYSCWDEFIHYANGLYSEAEAIGKIRPWNQPLFRGHSNSSWKLETTLERYGIANLSCQQYEFDMRTAGTTISTVASASLEYEDYEEPEHAWKAPSNYNVMAWLRQNGFPSPLLDWSRSPYVASFFAYSDANPESAEQVAIYSFIETKTGTRSGSRPAGAPCITTIGQWLTTDKKHHLQQSNYTISRHKDDERYYYSSHEEALEYEDPENTEQMVFTKCILPANERASVLQRLKLMNVTEYSLFETTGALLNTIADDLFD